MEIRLREILKERQITVAQFSEMSGITQANISNYMIGKTSPTLDTLNKIANTLGVELTQLFKKEEDVVIMLRQKNELFEIRKSDLIEFLKEKKK